MLPTVHLCDLHHIVTGTKRIVLDRKAANKQPYAIATATDSPRDADAFTANGNVVGSPRVFWVLRIGSRKCLRHISKRHVG
jgi:hypothetical protein